MLEPIRAELDEFDFRTCHHGYRALFASVVLLAISDALEKSRCIAGEKSSYKRSALNWVNSPVMAPGSFRWYCAYLDLDADAVREAVNKKAGLPSDRQRAVDVLGGRAA